MAASSHFMIPVSVATRRPERLRPAKPHHPSHPTAQEARLFSAADWEELDAARRRASLLALLAIYATGLGLVIMLYEGEDIGVVLSAFFAHAIYMATRGILAAARNQRIRTSRGMLVIHDRARLVRA